MTISNPSNRVVFVGPGNGFAYDRPVFVETDIFVEILTVAGDTIIPVLDGAGTFDFTVTGTFDADQFRFPNGVTVTLNNPLPAGDIITIENRVALVQQTDYVNGGPLNAERLETDFDRLVVMAQAPASILSDVLRISPASGFTLPPLIPAASEFLRWDSAGEAIESADITPTGELGIPVAVQDGGTGAETAAGARTNLAAAGTGDANTFTADQTISRSGVNASLEITRAGESSMLIGANPAAVFLDSQLTGGLFDIRIEGTNALRIGNNRGIVVPSSVTGGNQGAGTINASGIYDDGEQILPLLTESEVGLNGTTGTTFSGLRSGLKAVHVMLTNVSVDDSDNILIRIGDSGGLHTTGYVSTACTLQGAGNTLTNSTAGFVLNHNIAAAAYSGCMTLRLRGSNTWTAAAEFRTGTGSIVVTAGHVTLDTELTQVSILDTGADLFDGGTISIQTE